MQITDIYSELYVRKPDYPKVVFPFPSMNTAPIKGSVSLKPEFPILPTFERDVPFSFLSSSLPVPSSPIGNWKSSIKDKIIKHRISDIFRSQGEKLLNSGKLSPEQAKAVFSIINCRTESYGYHVDICDACGFVETGFNSCRNRHCPQCQGIAKKKWVKKRIKELLPVPYHHVVFTVPFYISMLSLYNQKIIYDLLFYAASQTLLTFGRDPKFLGAEIGFYGILHTWSQTLGPHIHIHFIVTAGGLTEDGKWIEPKKHGDKFLFPVRALSKVFRGKFIEGLKELYYNNELTIPDSMSEINTPKGFEKKLNQLVSNSWWVYSKPPFSGPEEVVRYIGRYTHRIAITDSRIISFENGQVTFSYKDNTEKDPEKKIKEMTLSAEEFVKKFLYHILPYRYHRIRNYGFLSNGRKHQNIEIIRNQLPEEEVNVESDDTPLTVEEDEAPVCPVCEKGRMRTFLVKDRFDRIMKYDTALLKDIYMNTS